MNKIEKFEDIIAWQKARILTKRPICAGQNSAVPSTEDLFDLGR